MSGSVKGSTPLRAQDPVSRYAVYAHEIDPPAGEDPLSWMLLTRAPITIVEAALTILRWYGDRWRVEFNFRDAKQFWGLEDFMTIKPTPVTNAASLAFFMVNLSHCLLKSFRLNHPQASILDLKAYARGYRYAAEIINLLPQKTEPGFWAQALNRLTNLGRIHPDPSLPNFA